MKPLSRYFFIMLLTISPVLNFSAKAQTQTERIQTEKERAPEMSESAMQEIAAILEAKRNRTPEQRKIESSLLSDLNEFKANKESGKNKTESLEDQRVTVEIHAQVTDELLELIKNVSGEVISSSVEYKTIQAKLPLEVLEGIAARDEVRAITQAPVAHTNRKEAVLNPFVLKNLSLFLPRPDFGEPRNIIERMHILYAAPKAEDDIPVSNAFPVTGPPNSQGDIAHRAKEVRETFNATGKGIKIGVMSDSSRGLDRSQANGNLPGDVTVLPGQSGMRTDALDTGEGTAMMEIIYDLAPESKLFFASASQSPAQFAQNILDLRFKYGCDIIVDDVIWSNESPFQDTSIAQAVNAVTNNGGLYFSSAGNQGNNSDGTATTWEGDFKSGGELPALGSPLFDLNDFGEGVISNRITAASTSGALVRLLWADPWGAAENDYDLFVLDSTLTTVKAFSTNDQFVFPLPIEAVNNSTIRTGDRIILVRYGNSEPRALHLDTAFGTALLALTSDGGTYGHSAAAEAFSVAAVSAATARGAAFTGGVGNPVESFSTDGPRRIFFNEDGTPVTPGNYLFATNGGTARNKPDFAAADGVATSVAGFTSFFGTSAAAPHAAAIAAMIKGAKPDIKNDELRNLLLNQALDIGPKGRDKVSGAGLLSPLNTYLQALPSPFLELNLTQAYEIESANFNRFIEPGERGALSIIFKNNGTKRAEGVKAKVTTTTPGVKMVVDESDYWQISEGKAEANLQPFKFDLAPNAPCGYTINFTVTVSDNSGSNPRSFPISILTGRPGTTPFNAAYTGAAVTIPDASTEVSIKVPVSGISGAITKVAFRINGTDCTKPDGVGLQHDKVGDLAMLLLSPAGGAVTLMSLPGGAGMPGKNFCNTLLDDSGRSSIQTITPSGAPYSNVYRPAVPFSAFIGQNPNGIWDLRIRDLVATGTGKMNSFSILIYSWDCQKQTNALTEIEVQQ